MPGPDIDNRMSIFTSKKRIFALNDVEITACNSDEI
jgi:hypothetical protein